MDRKGLFFFLLFVSAAVFGLFLLARQHPTDYGWIPSCPTHSIFGIYCFGCGTMRAVHFLFQGNFAAALQCNLLTVLLAPYLVLLMFQFFRETVFHRTFKIPGETKIAWSIFIALIIFMTLRNIPISAFDCLRPPTKAEYLQEKKASAVLPIQDKCSDLLNLDTQVE